MSKINKNEDIEKYIKYSDRYIEDYDLKIYCTNDCKFWYDEKLKQKVFNENHKFKDDFKADIKDSNKLKGGRHLIYTKNINNTELYNFFQNNDFKNKFKQIQHYEIENSKILQKQK